MPEAFTTRLLCDFLLGRNSNKIRQGYWHSASGFGCMSRSYPDDVKELVKGLIVTGLIQNNYLLK
ncbi:MULTISPECIES: RQC domain-containing protein [unclassified Oceanispirochaeta]|uniref:RQC domain-containing protein n=1 Tax=unclassified Oceanispirochaeta TaxID=2635722 RepID=UPI000E08FF6E|nr:hypothetical protein [Oceanispirochaeta sp. M2]NPD73359.1 hypothetical protein [Oceanispirochaeta sp. M1]RDG31017.1 hypothetical protein DV872_14760 [Oceanispirochaeta sp. M1]